MFANAGEHIGQQDRTGQGTNFARGYLEFLDLMLVPKWRETSNWEQVPNRFG